MRPAKSIQGAAKRTGSFFSEPSGDLKSALTGVRESPRKASLDVTATKIEGNIYEYTTIQAGVTPMPRRGKALLPRIALWLGSCVISAAR